MAQQQAAPLPPPAPMLDPSLVVRSEQLRQEIAWLQTERRQYATGGPIVMMSVGGGVGLLSFYLYAASRLHEDSCGDPICREINETFETALLLAGTAGIVVAVVGLVKYQSRIGPRKHLDDQIRYRREELQSVDARIRVAPIIGPMSLRGISMALSF